MLLSPSTAVALLATLAALADAAPGKRDDAAASSDPVHVDLGYFDTSKLKPVVIGGLQKRSANPSRRSLEAIVLGLDERRLQTRAKYSWNLDERGKESLERDIHHHERRKRSLIDEIELEKRQIAGNETEGGGLDGSSSGVGSGFNNSGNGATSETELTNWGGDILYTIPVSIGTPPQKFVTHIDTGSPTLWVYGSECRNSVCVGHASYNNRDSSTAQTDGSPFSVKYGKGYVEGSAFNDTVEMGGWQGTQEFGAANFVQDMNTYKLTDAVGLSGWSWQVPSKPTPFWQNLCAAGAWTNKMFGLYLARDTRQRPSMEQQQEDPSNMSGNQPLQSMGNGGRISMNGYDKSLTKGDVTWVDLTSTRQPFWRVPLSSLHVNNKEEGASRTDVVLDSGTSLVYMPRNQYNAFWSAIPEATTLSRKYRVSSSQTDYPIFPCRNAAKLDIRVGFGGKEFRIDGSDLVMDSIDDTWCVGSFQDGTGLVDDMATPTRVAWLAGDSMMKNFYTIHRYEPPSVGFVDLADGTQNTTAESYGGQSGGGSGSNRKSAAGRLAATGAGSVLAAAVLALAAM